MAETIVVVTGATGMQGGGVVDHLLADKRNSYHVRGITRNPSSPKAKKLADRGVEVVQGDLEYRDTLVKAFQGAEAAFIVTDFASAKSAEKEFQQGKNAIDAAREAGVKFVVFSTLEDMPENVKSALPEIEPGYTVPHFEAKARVQDYLKQSGIPHASLLTSAFFDNFLGGMKLQKQGDAFCWGHNLGTAPHAWHAVGDIGGSTAEILANPDKYQGKTIPVNSGYITPADIEKELSKATNKTIRYHETTDEQMAGLPFPAAPELANMFAYYKRFPYYDQMREPSKCIYKGPSFAEWTQQNADLLKAQIPE